MPATSILQILKVNDPRSGEKNGKPWTMQDAECILLTDDGGVEEVGVLQLPRGLTKEAAPKPGIYLGTFALRADWKTRRIVAELTALQPYTTGKAPAKGA